MTGRGMVQASLDEVAERFGLPAGSFDFSPTGGNCRAFICSGLPFGAYLMLTGEDVLVEGDLDDFGAGVSVGLYGVDDEYLAPTVFVPFGESSPDALARLGSFRDAVVKAVETVGMK